MDKNLIFIPISALLCVGFLGIKISDAEIYMDDETAVIYNFKSSF